MLKREKLQFGESKYTCKLCEDHIADMIIEQIDKGYYIILDLDEYYLEHKTCYKKQFFPHISFIFGYDAVRKIFVTSEYDEHGIYRTMEYSFSDIQRAFLHANCRYLECVQANKSYRFQYSPDTLAKDIEAYLFGETLNDNYEKKILLDYDYWEFDFCGEIRMGIFAQKTLLDLLNSSLKVECKKENGLDLRNFRVLMGHKNILCESLRFASYNIGMPSTIAERYRTDVKDMAVILFHLAIKYNVSYKEKLLLKMIDILNRLSVSEKFILTETLEYLNRMPIVKGCSV